MLLALPDVTLIMVETKVHDLAAIALRDALAKVNFGGVIVYTDKPEAFDQFKSYVRVVEVPSGSDRCIAEPVVHVIRVPDWPDKLKAESFYYNESQQGITTSHALMYQWDAGVRDVSCWTDNFLAYDYIGAPWPGKRGGQWTPMPGLTVGNGGFTLMSKKLCDHLYEMRGVYGIDTDHALSCRRRGNIEAAIGAKWAPEELAFQFAFEHGNNAERGRPSFGYHDVFNWHLAMSRDEVISRARVMMNNAYVVRKTTKCAALNNACPYVQQTIGLDYIHATNRMLPGEKAPPRAGSPEHLIRRTGAKA